MTSQLLVRLDQQQELRFALWVAAQSGSLYDPRLCTDLARWHGKLEFERAYERENKRFHSGFEVRQTSVSNQYTHGVRLDLLDEGEPVSDACSRAAEEGKLVTPHTWNPRDGIWKVLPPFWPTVWTRE